MNLGFATAIATGLGVYYVYGEKGKIAAVSAGVTGVVLYAAYWLKLKSNPKINGYMGSWGTTNINGNGKSNSKNSTENSAAITANVNTNTNTNTYASINTRANINTNTKSLTNAEAIENIERIKLTSWKPLSNEELQTLRNLTN